MTEAQWLTYAKKLESRPPMPWFNVRAMTDDDLKALYVYINQMPGGLAQPRRISHAGQGAEQPFIQWPGVK